MLSGVVLRRQRREVANGAIRYRVTVLAGAQTEVYELYNVPEEAVPAIGSKIRVQAGVRTYVDRNGVARYSLHPAVSENEF